MLAAGTIALGAGQAVERIMLAAGTIAFGAAHGAATHVSAPPMGPPPMLPPGPPGACPTATIVGAGAHIACGVGVVHGGGRRGAVARLWSWLRRRSVSPLRRPPPFVRFLGMTRRRVCDRRGCGVTNVCVRRPVVIAVRGRRRWRPVVMHVDGSRGDLDDRRMRAARSRRAWRQLSARLSLGDSEPFLHNRT